MNTNYWELICSYGRLRYQVLYGARVGTAAGRDACATNGGTAGKDACATNGGAAGRDACATNDGAPYNG